MKFHHSDTPFFTIENINTYPVCIAEQTFEEFVDFTKDLPQGNREKMPYFTSDACFVDRGRGVFRLTSSPSIFKEAAQSAWPR
jgi:hypothetical protein